MIKKNEDATGDLYKFEPIKGYPMLNWQGKRPFRSTQYYPAQLKEQHGKQVEGWMNELYWGDNLQVMSHLLKKYRGKVQLICIDPPFDSKADYKKKIEMKGLKVENDYTGFEEKQYGDIWTNDEYLQFMYERFVLLRELLADDGSIYVHMDEKRSHYIKIVMDEIFGADNFQREIVWDITVLSGFKTQAQNWIRGHDTIFFYSKTQDKLFNKLTQPHRKEYLDRFNKTDKDGRKYFDGRGEILYLDEVIKKGKTIGDVWGDIMSFQQIPTSKEKVNYPTQKPEALYERIIKASSNPGGIVLDVFTGSGTAQAVAMKLGRRFIGADINLGAIQTTTKRLLNVASELKNGKLDLKENGIDTFYTSFSVYNVNYYDFFRNHVEAKELLMDAYEIQPFPSSSLYDGELDSWMVKIMPVDRIATRLDLNELIMNFDRKSFNKRRKENPGKPVEKVLIICMGHELDLAAELTKQMNTEGYEIKVRVVDVLREKAKLEFKRDSEAKVARKKGKLVIDSFYPMNLLQKLSLAKTAIKDWRELTESVMIDWNYNGKVFTPTTVDVPDGKELVSGEYAVPADAATIKVKLTDLLSESCEVVVNG